MKLGNKLSFGLSAVQSGQKLAAVVSKPTLTANSTTGKFTVTPAVSKALNVSVGENIMFFNNRREIEEAISIKDDALVAVCQEAGIDLDTEEGVAQVIKEFTEWYIAKGELLYDSKGNPVMACERYTAADKQAYIDAHIDEYLADDDTRAELARRCEEAGVEATDENMAAKLTVDDVETPKFHAMSGSKTSTTSTATGVGAQLSFTDTAIWNMMKEDLGDDKASMNRIYDVDVAHPLTTEFNNGKENVSVRAYKLEFDKDTAPIVREKK